MPHHETKQPKATRKFRLYVMRHGIAVARGSSGFPNDAERPLTPEGKAKMKVIARGLITMGVRVDSVVTSPFLRARETAEIVAESFGHNLAVQFSDDLQPGRSLEGLIAHLGKLGSRGSTLVVGHEPDLSDGVARLIGASPRANFRFKKGGCCRIDFEDFPQRLTGKMVWWLTPRVLRKMKS